MEKQIVDLTSVASPPKASLAFRVGIVGHRPNRLPKDSNSREALRRTLRAILAAVKSELEAYGESELAKVLYSDVHPKLRAVTPLAEGCDRIFAQEAIYEGFEIVCPMPFHQANFEKDFIPPTTLEEQSLIQFQSILKQARDSTSLTVFELDGDRRLTDTAYSLAGEIVINQSDLLIVVWDGFQAAGGGGTVDTFRAALRYHMPVIWIDAQAPNQWQLVRSVTELPQLVEGVRCRPNGNDARDEILSKQQIEDAVREIVRDEVAWVSHNAVQRLQDQSQPLQYFCENKPRFNVAIVWRLFRDLVGSGRIQVPRIRMSNFEGQAYIERRVLQHSEGTSTGTVEAKKSSISDTPARKIDDWLDSRLQPHYLWADRLAEYYADAYRSAYVATYLFSAAAVFFALLPLAMNWGHTQQLFCVATEFAIMLIILILLLFGRWRRWHERWLQYRLLAELIRQLQILLPLGGGRPFPTFPSHLGVYGAPTQTWMYWHMRGIARDVGIPEVRVSSAYSHACLNHLFEVVQGESGQLKFHEISAVRCNNIAHRLHASAACAFFFTIVAIVLHGALEIPAVERGLHIFNFENTASMGRWLVLASATLPALGAALAGISNQGEFARVAKRAQGMVGVFGIYAARIDAVRTHAANERSGPRFSEMIPIANEIAATMVEEVSDWRAVFADRPHVVA
jgi:hypothetical protein